MNYPYAYTDEENLGYNLLQIYGCLLAGMKYTYIIKDDKSSQDKRLGKMSIQEQIEALQKEASQIEAKNAYWKSCQDGSYEMALSYAGFYELHNKIRQLKEELKNAG